MAEGTFPTIREFEDDPVISVDLRQYAQTSDLVVELRPTRNASEIVASEIGEEEAKKLADHYQATLKRKVSPLIVQACQRLAACWVGPATAAGNNPTPSDLIAFSIANAAAFVDLMKAIGKAGQLQLEAGLEETVVNFPDAPCSTNGPLQPVSNSMDDIPSNLSAPILSE